MKYSILGAFLLLPTYLFSQSATINFTASQVFDSQEQELVLGTLGLLVADTGGDGFVGDYMATGTPDFSGFAGTTLAAEQAIGSAGDDLIVSVLSSTTYASTSSSFNDSVSVNLASGSSFSSGQEIGFYWFPGLSSNDESIAGTVDEYGFYRNDSAIDGFESEFTIPANGANLTIGVLTSIGGGSTPIADVSAQAIPEPSAYATIAGLLGLAYAVTRRRRRSSLSTGRS